MVDGFILPRERVRFDERLKKLVKHKPVPEKPE
jgi:hypothetical protein